MRGTELSRDDWRRLDEVVEEWGRWICRRWEDAPGVEASAVYSMGPDLSRQWRTSGELADENLSRVAKMVDGAIGELDSKEQDALVVWARVQFYNRAVNRKVFRSGRPSITDKWIEEIKLKLAPKLRARGLM